MADEINHNIPVEQSLDTPSTQDETQRKNSCSEQNNEEIPKVENPTSNEDDSSQLDQNPSPTLNNKVTNEDLKLLDSDPTEITNDNSSFTTPIMTTEKSDEVKTQHEIDEQEHPPTESPQNQESIHIDTHNTSADSTTLTTDDRPLSKLEMPYEQNENNQTNTNEQTSTHVESTDATTTHRSDNDQTLEEQEHKDDVQPNVESTEAEIPSNDNTQTSEEQEHIDDISSADTALVHSKPTEAEIPSNDNIQISEEQEHIDDIQPNVESTEAEISISDNVQTSEEQEHTDDIPSADMALVHNEPTEAELPISDNTQTSEEQEHVDDIPSADTALIHSEPTAAELPISDNTQTSEEQEHIDDISSADTALVHSEPTEAEMPISDNTQISEEQEHIDDISSTDKTTVQIETTKTEIPNDDDYLLRTVETANEHGDELTNHQLKDDKQHDSTTYSEHQQENKTNNLSLPDIVSETIDKNSNDFIPPIIELEKAALEEIVTNNENNNIDENLPPLPATSIAYEKAFQTTSSDLDNEQQSLSSDSSKVEDVLGNKTLFKQTLVKGTPNTRPTRSTLATISYKLSLIDERTSNIREIENVSNKKLFISEFDTLPAIDICVQLMDRGERASIISDVRHCYGNIGCEEKQIPIVSSSNWYKMQIELELHDWISPPDVQQLSIDERIFWGNEKQQTGNFNYRRGDYQTSFQCYRGALRFFDIENNPIRNPVDQSQRSILIDRYCQVLNNVAQVNIQLNKYEACLNAVENVLKYDPNNAKALFRQGKALYELGLHDRAIHPLKLFSQLHRSNSTTSVDNGTVNEMIHVCENKLAHYEKNEKEIYRRMFQPSVTSKNTEQRQINKSNQSDGSWLPYIALGTAALTAVGFLTFFKYRTTS